MKRLWIVACAVAVLAACQKNVEPEVAPGNVQVEPVITKATEVNFEDGDLIGLTVKKVNDTENYASNEKLVFADNVFSGELKWYTDAYSESDVYAYYPYDAEGVPTTFSVALDQTSGIGTSDFMAASKQGVLPTLGPVTMVFRHQMTKLVINVDNQTGSPVTDVLVQNTVPKATVDVASLAAGPADGEGVADIKAYEVTDDAVYSAIVVPQTAAIKISVVFENKKVMTQPLASMTLKAGGQYSIDVRVLADDMTVSATGEIENWTDEGKIDLEGGSEVEELPVTFTEYDGYFEYDGVRYDTKKFDDGNTWMVDNLRFIPRGKTVSSDPTDGNGIWYPYAVNDGIAAALTDEASAETYGYLYDYSTALGAEITSDNYLTFEGVRGICPQGWHIPTRDEYLGLCGLSGKNTNVGETGDVYNEDAPFYDADNGAGSLVIANEKGFNFVPTGIMNRTANNKDGAYSSVLIDDTKNTADKSWNGRPALTYYMASTGYKPNPSGTNIQFFGMMTTFTAANSYGKLNCSYTSYLSGYPIRCVKNK